MGKFLSLGDILQALWLSFLSCVWGLASFGVVYLWAGLGVLFNNPFFVVFGAFIVLFPLPIILFCYIHYFLWGDPRNNKPAWMASNASMREGTWQWFISSTASIVVLIMMIGALVIFHPYTWHNHYYYSYRYRGYWDFDEQLSV